MSLKYMSHVGLSWRISNYATRRNIFEDDLSLYNYIFNVVKTSLYVLNPMIFQAFT